MKVFKAAALALLLSTASFSVVAQVKETDAIPRTPEQVLAGSITSGTASWANTSTTWTSTSTGPSHNFLIAGQDQVFQDWWWYRLSTDTREFTLPTPTTEVYVGDTATLSWTNFNATGLNATLVVVVADAPARVTHTLTITNPTGSPVTLSAFRYVDFDIAGTFGADSAVIASSPDFMTVSEGAVSVPYSASGAANFAVTAFSTLRGLLTNTAVDNLANTGLPFGPGDFTGGFQFAPRVIAASGGATVFTAVYGAPPGPPPAPALIYGITGAAAGTNLVSFAPTTPGTVTTIGPLTGIVAGHSVRAIDARPATGQVYVFSTNATNGFQLYTVNTATGALTPVGAGGTVVTNWGSTRISMDFNPAADRLRVVTGATTPRNYRFNPIDGTLVAEDTALAYVAGDPNVANNPPFPSGVAYDNNDNDPGTATTLFLYDFNTDALSRVGSVGGSPVSPNTGQLTTIFTPAGFVTNDAGLGFDVGPTNTAYLSYADFNASTPRAAEARGVGTETFSTINLTTGAITVVGTFPVGIDMLDITHALPAGAPPAAADLAATLTDSPDPVVAGTNLTYTATATNNGPDPAAAVSITVNIPGGTTFVSATPSATGSCSGTTTVLCNWAAATATGAANARSVVVVVSVPASASGSLNATATVATTTADPTPANNTASQTTTVGSSADLTVALTDNPDPVTAGTNLTYTATVTNTGPSDAQGVNISLPLPGGTSFVSADPGAGGSCTGTTTVDCTWAGPTVPTGTRVANIVVLVSAAQTASLSATVTAASSTADPTSPNTSTQATAVVTSANITLTLTDSPDPVTAGENLTYVATVSNAAGPSDAAGVTVTMPTPANTSFVSGTVAGGGSCTGGVTISCTFTGTLAVGASRAANIVVLVAAATPNGTVITANATATTTTPDPAVPNTATTTTTVSTTANLALTLTAVPAEVNVNEPVVFTATSTNLGPSDAQDVSISITLSPDFRFASLVAGSATCTTPQIGNSGVITCTWAGATAPNAVRTLAVTAYSNAVGTSSIMASTASPTVDPLTTNNTVSVSVLVGAAFEPIPSLDLRGLLLLGLLMGLMGFVAIRRQA